MGIPIAVSTRHRSSESTLEALSHIAAMGYTDIELELSSPDEILYREKELRELINKQQLTIHAFHAPTPLLSGLDKAEYVEWIQIFVNIAKSFGVKTMILHPDIVVEQAASAIGGRFDTSAEAQAMFVEAMKEIAPQLDRVDVHIALENSGPDKPSFFKEHQQVKHVLSKIGSDMIGVTLDISHAERIGPGTSIEMIENMGKKIIHLHVSDCVHTADHLPLGRGNIEVEKLVHEVLRCCSISTMTLEVLMGSAKEIADSYDVLKKAQLGFQRNSDV